MQKLRVYLDTSVFGGCFDREFREHSEKIFSMVRRGELTIIVSPLLAAEIRGAPAEVESILNDLPPGDFEEITISAESERLRDRYIEAGVVGQASLTDAHHVALATICQADMIISWNFKHIVHYDKMRGFNMVNRREGYAPIEIHSPREVV